MPMAPEGSCGVAREFQAQVYPMVICAGPSEMQMKIALSDLPVFCRRPARGTGSEVTVEDPRGLLEAYSPDDCTCYYFDMEGDSQPRS